MTPDHPLDRPVWSALTSRQSPLAQGGDRARRFAPEYGPLTGIPDFSPGSLEALTALDFGEDGLWVLQSGDLPIPQGTVATKRADCHQMMARDIKGVEPRFDVLPLGEDDASEMLALATWTKPGPFARCTHRLGQFIGVRQDGLLVAMAGERLQPDGFAEVSGVCTHPDYRGRGYAAGLMRLVTQRILARGETPFLHTYADNAGAIALYETLGFAWRATIPVTVLQPEPPRPD